MDWRTRIVSDNEVLLGKPTIKGTRISVELLLKLFSNAWTTSMILESYPKLTEQDILAVFAYLKDCVEQEYYFPVSKSA